MSIYYRRPTPLVARDIVMTDGERRVLDGIDLLAHPCRRSASSARTARANPP